MATLYIGQRSAPNQGRTLLLVFLMAIALLGCGADALKHTVDPGELKYLSTDGRAWIYDAENQVVVALDRLDRAMEEVALGERRILEAGRMQETARKSMIPLRVVMIQSWRDHLESRARWARQNAALHRLGVLLAQGKVEMARAQVIHREGLAGRKSVNIGEFQKQQKELERAYKGQGEQVKRLLKEARGKQKSWWDTRKRYVARTGDHDSGLWVQ